MAEAVSSSDLTVAARTLLLDRAAGVAIEMLRSQGIDAILLKGAAIATWLYEDQVRPYIDVDLFVSPAQFEMAAHVLAGLGYSHQLEGADPAELGPKERELVGPDGVFIDLHLGLLGIDGPPQQTWEILSKRTVDFKLTGSSVVQVFDLPARAMHLALHAAQNGPIDVKAFADLERGVARLRFDVWQDAAALAAELGATEAFAAGLRIVPAGRTLADQLSLPHRISVELVLRTQSAPQQAIFIERLRATRGGRRKAALIARKLFPTATYLRANVPWARRGRIGLLFAWVTHPWFVACGTAPAVIAWTRARSAADDSRDKSQP